MNSSPSSRFGMVNRRHPSQSYLAPDSASSASSHIDDTPPDLSPCDSTSTSSSSAPSMASSSPSSSSSSSVSSSSTSIPPDASRFLSPAHASHSFLSLAAPLDPADLHQSSSLASLISSSSLSLPPSFSHHPSSSSSNAASSSNSADSSSSSSLALSEPAASDEVHEAEPEVDENEKICRICHGDESDDRLISPCKCSGSMKFVHAGCLAEWRTMSANPASFFQCDNCKFRYSFRRTRVAEVLSSRLSLHLLTLLLFCVLVLLGGYALKFMERYSVDDPPPFNWTVDLDHLIYGIGAIGASGFISLLITVRGGGMLFHTWSMREGRSQLEAIVFMILILVGLVKCIFALYKLVEKLCDRVLSAAHNMVENVS